MSDSFEVTSGYTDGDIDTNPTSNSHLSDLIDRRYSRRETLRGGASAAAIAVFGGALLAACDDESDTDDDSAPVVTAGSSGATSAGRLVTLTSTVTDDGGIVTSSWTQVSGPTVTLSGATTATATFVAPAVAAGTPLVFRYTATDQSGQASSADTTVTISPAQLGFTAVAKNRNDVVTVPTGYSVAVLARLGDPIAEGVAAYANNGTDTNFAQRIGDHGDALYYYGLNAAGARDDNSNIRGVLVQNYENLNEQYLHPNGPTNVSAGPRPEAEAIKEIEAHGVGVIEVIQGTTGWSYVQNSAFNRRITPNTPVTINGPVRGSTLVRTAFSPAGTDGRGTINNCANGVTPWATNLTCEENWAGYFRRPTAVDNPRRTAKEVTALARYGVGSTNGNYAWASVTPADSSSTIFRKWDAQATGASATADYRNEPNQYGWCVEIDPYDRTKAPRKRTALGRFNHEGAWPGNFVVGRRPAWYMGDDAQNEYLYKFVSATPWVAADATAADRLAIGDKYLDNGTLYVARFNANGSGEWLPLVFGQGPLTAANTVYSYADQADVLTHARLAADALGATRMDRPEWTAVSPTTGEMYLTLTNNSSRTPATTDASNPRAYIDPPSASISNRNGHILRLRETGDTTEATGFAWDIYAFGAGSDLDATNINLSGLTADNDFSSPDGLWFGRSTNATGQVNPLLWVQTDDGAFTDQTNNQMLAALPGRVGDGGTRTVTNTAANGTTTTVTTRIGAAPGTQLRRFLTGPIQCEITGVDTTPDGRTMFVGIQHPGEGGTPAMPSSAWPATQGATTAPAAGTRPRSGIVVIRKNDGGVVAL
ncbi:PhoX family phosphatase [Sphingomonas sp. S1-29]|uniref:PhoX family protein n=1 Tax=Sphingomonas sp. S1-29 TaxID=2991074 RepID=UPI002240884C|nr:alkaline phosphatase PhoX [Sphingomonas sp. S1-29]UZK70518.1 PhoX family phosphatase [Sphingomonas sp. S1-29]